MIPTKCIQCSSERLAVVNSGPHKKLYCVNCLAFQKFLSKEDCKVFLEKHKKDDTPKRQVVQESLPF